MNLNADLRKQLSDAAKKNPHVQQPDEHAATDQQPILRVRKLCMRFGGLLAVDNVEFDLLPQQVFGIIGPNGAGKTTVFNCISGFYRATQGEIYLQDKPLHGLASHRIAKLGEVSTFQNVRLFNKITVFEKLLVESKDRIKTDNYIGLLRILKYLVT